MVRRRKKHLLHELTALPWWMSFVVAAIVYAAVRWLLPMIGGPNKFLRPLGEALHDKAWWFAAPFVVVAGMAAFNAYYRRRLLDKKRDLIGSIQRKDLLSFRGKVKHVVLPPLEA